MSDDRLAMVARRILTDASTPVKIGPPHDRTAYVLIPARALTWLSEAMTPEQREPTPYIYVSPTMKGGTPVINGQRLTAEMIAEQYWYLGEHLESEVLRPYDLRRGDVVICCWYVTEYGRRIWRKRWKDWVREVWGQTREDHGWWRKDWNEIPLPPYRTAPLPASRGETA